MIIKTNVIYQKDRRIRLPKLIEDNWGLTRGLSNFDIFIEDDKIILKESNSKKVNNYNNKHQNGDKK